MGDLLDLYLPPGCLDFLSSLFGAVPLGFSLSIILGLAAFGVSRLLRLARDLLR